MPQTPVYDSRMLLLTALLAAAYAADIGDVGKLRCYTVQGKKNLTEEALTCGVAIPADGNCSAYSNNKETEVGGRRDRGDYRDIAMMPQYSARKERVCSVSFKGRCGRQCGPIDKLCFTIVEDSASYPDALSNCANRGGHLFVPDSDADLAKLIKMIDGRIKSFWIGGGTTFSRFCNRVEPNEQGLEPAVTFTVNGSDRSDRKGVLGYVSTRIATQKFPFICAKVADKGPKSECLLIAEDKKEEGPIITECKLQPTRFNGGDIRDTGCIPGGPLQFGDLLTFYSIQSSNAGHWWSYNLFPTNWMWLFHCAVRQSEGKLVLNNAFGRYGSDAWNSERWYTPFPYRSGGVLSKTTITNTPSGLMININDVHSYSFSHKGKNPNQDYVTFSMMRPYRIVSNVTVNHGGTIYALPLSDEQRFVSF